MCCTVAIIIYSSSVPLSADGSVTKAVCAGARYPLSPSLFCTRTQYALLEVCFFVEPQEYTENKALGLQRTKIWWTALHVIDSEHFSSLQYLSPSFQFFISLEYISLFNPPVFLLGFPPTLHSLPGSLQTNPISTSGSSTLVTIILEEMLWPWKVSIRLQTNNKMATLFICYKPFPYLLLFCFVLLVDTPFGAEMQISASFDVMNTNVFFINLPNDCYSGPHPAFS